MVGPIECFNLFLSECDMCFLVFLDGLTERQKLLSMVLQDVTADIEALRWTFRGSRSGWGQRQSLWYWNEAVRRLALTQNDRPKDYLILYNSLSCLTWCLYFHCADNDEGNLLVLENRASFDSWQTEGPIVLNGSVLCIQSIPWFSEKNTMTIPSLRHFWRLDKEVNTVDGPLNSDDIL